MPRRRTDIRHKTGLAPAPLARKSRAPATTQQHNRREVVLSSIQSLVRLLQATMGNPDEEELISPEELVLEAVASSVVDPEKEQEQADAESAAIEQVIALNQEEASEKKLSNEDELDKAKVYGKLENGDVEAALPPDLTRATARSASQPGAYRASSSDAADLLSQGSSSSVSAAAAAVRTTLTTTTTADTMDTSVERDLERQQSQQPQHMVEAHLVEEQPSPPPAPIYKAAVVVQDEPKSTRSRMWIGLGGLFCVVIVSASAIAIALAFVVGKDKKAIQTQSGIQGENSGPGQGAPRPTSMDGYRRVTSHVALARFVKPERCVLYDNYVGNTNSTLAQVTLKCGQESPPSLPPPRIQMWDSMNTNCQQLSSSEMSCTVDTEQSERFLFFCGTNAESYSIGSNETTAEIKIQENLSFRCASERRVQEGETSADVTKQPLASFLSVGRFCKADELAPDQAFMTHVKCSDDASLRVSNLNDYFGYCLQEEYESSCDSGSDCLHTSVDFERLSAADRVSTEACESATFFTKEEFEAGTFDLSKDRKDPYQEFDVLVDFKLSEFEDTFVDEWKEQNGYLGFIPA